MNIPIKQRVWDNMINYACAAHQIHGTEIAGWGHYTHQKGIYKLAPLCKQEVKAAEVDNFPDEILHRVDYDMSDMVVQWHSHVNMGTTPSSVDTKNIADAMKLFDTLISIIVNIRGEYSCRIDYKTTNFYGGTMLQTIDKVQLEIGSNKVPMKIWEEVMVKCYKPKPIVIESKYDWYTNPHYPYNGVERYAGAGFQIAPPTREPEVTVNDLFPDTKVETIGDLVGNADKIRPVDKDIIYRGIYDMWEHNKAKIHIIEQIPAINEISLQLFDGNIVILDDDGVEFGDFVYYRWADFKEAIITVYGLNIII